jgi:type II secretory pathway component GspD/PulD (secretin)
VKDRLLDLHLTIRVAEETRRGSHRAGSLHTQVMISPGRPMVVGVIPTRGQTSAFVVQVVVKAAEKGPAKLPARKAAFEFENKPWSAVFAWLSDETGLPVVTSFKPTGSFTFIPPNGRKYTISEIIDILNESLLVQKYLLIRRQGSFALLPADEKPENVPLVRVEDLKDYGNSELVSVIIPLRMLDAEDVAPEVKKLLGPFGSVVVLKKAGSLLVEDTAGQIRRVLGVLQAVEEAPPRAK